MKWKPKCFILKNYSKLIKFETFRPFTKFLTTGLTCKLGNLQDDELDWLIATNHQAGYLIQRLTWWLKISWIKSLSDVKLRYALLFFFSLSKKQRALVLAIGVRTLKWLSLEKKVFWFSFHIFYYLIKMIWYYFENFV